MDSLNQQFILSALINGLVHFMILTACIVLIVKKKSIGTILLLIGSILSLFGYAGSYLFNILAARQGAEALLNAQGLILLFSGFSYLIFGLGLLVYIIYDVKKHNA